MLIAFQKHSSESVNGSNKWRSNLLISSGHTQPLIYSRLYGILMRNLSLHPSITKNEYSLSDKLPSLISSTHEVHSYEVVILLATDIKRN